MGFKFWAIEEKLFNGFWILTAVDRKDLNKKVYWKIKGYKFDVNLNVGGGGHTSDRFDAVWPYMPYS